MEAERLFFLVIALALAYGVGCLGRTRKIGFWPAFLISILNVIIGLIAVPKMNQTNNWRTKL